MASILDNAVSPNDYNFTEKKVFGPPVAVKVTNSTTRTLEFGETVFLNGYIGNVMNQDGIPAAEDGEIDINPNRHVSTNQVDAGDTFAAQMNPIYFVPQSDSAAGKFVDALSSTESVPFKAEVIGSAPAADPAYIEYKPAYQNGDLEPTT
jgi:hypothetical protein